MAAMLARKAGGRDPLEDGGEPSPPSHIKAVFGAPEDRDFYGPMAGAWWWGSWLAGWPTSARSPSSAAAGRLRTSGAAEREHRRLTRSVCCPRARPQPT